MTLVLRNGMSTEVLFEDELLLLANKPSGIPVHETKDPGRDDFSRLLAEALGMELPRCVNRLDLLTTGIVVFGKDPGRNAEIDKIMNGARKYYHVGVRGKLPEREFTLQSFLKDGNKRVKTVFSGGKKAITRFEVLSHDKKSDRTILQAELVTGRRHQIRIHLAEHGFPVIGDPVYGDAPDPKSTRLLLHAWKLVLPDYGGLEISSPADFIV